MGTYYVEATDATPGYRVSTVPNYAKCVYALMTAAYKGAVLPAKTPGLYVARAPQNTLVRNPAHEKGLWASEREAMDALAQR